MARSAIHVHEPLTYEKRVARKLREVFESEWGGKARGRFVLAHKQLSRLAGFKRLHSNRIEELLEACEDEGIILIDLDGEWLVLSQKWVDRSRRANNRVLGLNQLVVVSQEDDDED